MVLYESVFVPGADPETRIYFTLEVQGTLSKLREHWREGMVGD